MRQVQTLTDKVQSLISQIAELRATIEQLQADPVVADPIVVPVDEPDFFGGVLENDLSNVNWDLMTPGRFRRLL